MGILAASALVALSIVVFEPSVINRSFAEVARQGPSGPVVDCSGASAVDYACYQERYQDLVQGSGVKAAFEELKDEYKKNDFVRSGCHQLTHVIGRAAAERYGDIAEAFGHGVHFCGTGYYHGVMEGVVAKTGPDEISEEADMLCADLRESQRYSDYHFGCAHGLGHGFMGVLENELFEALKACDALTDGWEREHCYGGVSMENVMAQDNPSHPSKYLKADQPLYPCTDVEARYKDPCYRAQTWYLLKTQGYDFAKAFDLCATEAEDDYRPTCYEYLGHIAARHNAQTGITDEARTNSTNQLCMLGEDHEARFNCLIGAVGGFIYHYRSDEQAKALCESFEGDLRAVCLQTAEERYRKGVFSLD